MPSAAALAFAAGVAVFSWRVGAASAWRDEAVTQGVAGRPFGQILALTGEVDLVHVAYYLLTHLVHLVSGDFVALRWLSVLLFAAAAAVTVLIGVELGSLRHGLAAAAVVVVSPFANSYAQQARPYALTTCVATVSVLVLLRTLRRDAAGARAWAGYVVAVVACGLANTVSLLVLLPHAAVVLTRARHRRAAVRSWVTSVAVGLLVLSPFLAVAVGQRAQVAWLTRPTPGRLGTVLTFGFGPRPELVATVVVALAVSVALAVAVPRLRVLWLVCATWGFVPVLVLWLLSQGHPLFDGRYVAFCLPGAALTVSLPVRLRPARGPAWLRRWTVPVVAAGVVGLLAVLAWPYQMRVRATPGVEDLRGTAVVLRENVAPGDAVLYLPPNFRLIAGMYPTGLPRLNDLTLAESARASGTLIGVNRTADQVIAALAGEPMVWLVTRAGTPVGHDPDEIAELAALRRCFALTRVWTVHQFSVNRYQRMPDTVPGTCRG